MKNFEEKFNLSEEDMNLIVAGATTPISSSSSNTASYVAGCFLSCQTCSSCTGSCNKCNTTCSSCESTCSSCKYISIIAWDTGGCYS
jgi:hypothetical protein